MDRLCQLIERDLAATIQPVEAIYEGKAIDSIACIEPTALR
jgi:hypothetical protein